MWLPPDDGAEGGMVSEPDMPTEHRTVSCTGAVDLYVETGLAASSLGVVLKSLF